jgi:nucleotide-binding universal stress UspA family protein
MNTTFNTILIPVDFTVNTAIAIEKALMLCEEDAHIHLLHVPSAGGVSVASFHQNFAPYSFDTAEVIESCRAQMITWNEYINEKRPHIRCFNHIEMGGTIQELVILFAKQIRADLIVIGKHSQHSWLPFLNTVVSTKIANKTGIPVLTAKPGAYYQTPKLIVIPINSGSTEKKIELAKMLSRKFRLQVRLVTVMPEDDRSNFPPMSLIKAYQSLKNSIANVSYELLNGAHQVKKIVQYCKDVKADMLIVHPGLETTIGWMNKQISDELSPASRMQVLAIQPS